MAQSSYPQAGYYDAVTLPDSGPYSANEWKGWMLAGMRSGGMIQTGAAAPPGLPATPPFPNVGVWRAVDNLLAVTSPGASQISIDTGAGLCDGIFFLNDTIITPIAITNPAGNPRIDRVVIRQNYSAALYTSVNAAALTVPASTARLIIISGAEAGAPVAPGWTQDQDRLTYWDTPIYQYEIAVAGTITGLTDERDWVDAETKQFVVQAVYGYNQTDGTELLYGMRQGWNMTDEKLTWISGAFYLGDDFISDLNARVIFRDAPNNNNIYGGHIMTAGACGEAEDIRSVDTGNIAQAMTQNVQNCLYSSDFPGAAVDDIIKISFSRLATDVLDTIGTYVNSIGFLVEYLGWGRK